MVAATLTTVLDDAGIVDELHVGLMARARPTRIGAIKAAFWQFQRDLKRLAPRVLFRWPDQAPESSLLGARIPREDERGKTVYDLNEIAIPKVQKAW